MTPPVVALQGTPGGAFDQILDNVIRFVPRLVWSLGVLAVGVGVAIFVSGRAEDAVEESGLFADRFAGPFAYGVRVLLYFFAVTIALGELGLQTGVMVVFLDGLAFGLGVAVALALGIAVGWGSKDYVAEHVEEWIADAAAEPSGESAASGDGTSPEAEAADDD